MAASAQDQLLKVASNTGWQLDASGISDAAVTSFGLVSATGLPTTTAVILTVDRVNSSGVATPSKMERIKGIVSGTSIISCTRGFEGTAQAHAAGAVVEIVISAGLWNSVIDGTDTHKATEKPTPVDADELGLIDSAASNVLKKLTWANLKATLKTYFDTLYPPISGKDGWISVSDSWAYASATTITVPSGAASLYQKGDKIKITQSAVVYYFYISGVADTVLTVAGEQAVANSAISSIYYSHMASPVGFKKGEDYYRAGVYLSGGQSIAFGTPVTLQLNTEAFDTNSNFNTGTYQYTVPVTGYYNVSAYARVEAATAGGYTQFYIYNNAASIKECIVVQNASYYFAHITDVIPLTKGDLIDVRCSNNSTTRTLSGGNGTVTRFSIQFVGI